MWDERYSEPGYAYGKDPNEFLASDSSGVDRDPAPLAMPGVAQRFCPRNASASLTCASVIECPTRRRPTSL